MRTEKEFLTNVYSQLLEIEAVLGIMGTSCQTLDDSQITPAFENVCIASGMLKRKVEDITDKIDKRLCAEI